MKFSIIICSYNGENYMDACLESIFKQTYSNYEVLFTNDGSIDKTEEKLKDWKKKFQKKLKVITKGNTGLGDSRNIGVEHSKGDYILFLDIDDTLEPNTLNVLNNVCDKDIDLVRFSCNLIYSNHVEPISTNYPANILVGEEVLPLFIFSKLKKNLFEMAQLYAYRKEYWIENNFSFVKGRYHEDFGLIPYAILKAKQVKIINTCLYNYTQTENSIIRNHNDEIKVKKANDIFDFYLENKEKLKQKQVIDDTVKRQYLSYMVNAIMMKYQTLKGKEKQKYKERIQNHFVLNDLLSDTILRRIKKEYFKILVKF